MPHEMHENQPPQEWFCPEVWISIKAPTNLKKSGPEWTWLAELVETKHNFLWNISESRFDLLNSLS